MIFALFKRRTSKTWAFSEISQCGREDRYLAHIYLLDTSTQSVSRISIEIVLRNLSEDSVSNRVLIE